MSWTLRHDIDHSETVNGITYRVARTKEDAKEVTELFIKYMLRDEPIAVALGGVKLGDKAAAVEAQMEDIVQDGVSIMAIDTSNGQLAGIRTSHVFTRDTCPQTHDSLESLLAVFPGDYARIMWLLDQVIFPKEVFDDHPDDNRLFDMFALCIHPDYRGRGMANELVAQAFKVARKAKCDSVAVCATNNATRHIFDKIGMTRTRNFDFEEIVVGGEKFFKGVKAEGITGHYIKLSYE